MNVRTPEQEREAFEAAMGSALLEEQGEFALSRGYEEGRPYTFLATKWAFSGFQSGAAWQRTQAAGVPDGWRSSLEDAALMLEAHSPGSGSVESYAAQDIRAMLAAAPAQPAIAKEATVISEVKHYWPEEIVGTGELVVYLQDYAALEAECERLRVQVSALQSDANSWQSGYDKGREDGAKAAEGWKAQHARDSAELRRLCSERDALRAELAAIKGQEPVLWFRSLIGAQCKPDGRCYDVVFSPCEGFMPLYALPPAQPEVQRLREALEWAVDRWHAEVASRPLVNVHRRALDDTWRQIIRRLGGDAGLLCGPAHDELLALAASTGQEEANV